MDLLITFPDQSASFAHGVEYGRLLEKMERGDDPVKNNGFPVRVENKNVIQSSCSVYGYIPVFGPEADGWINFLGVKKVSSDN